MKCRQQILKRKRMLQSSSKLVRKLEKWNSENYGKSADYFHRKRKKIKTHPKTTGKKPNQPINSIKHDEVITR